MSVYKGTSLLAGVATNTISNSNYLLDWKWSDHIINSMEWLRADTFSWQSGSVYTSVYNHLVADNSSGTSQTETVGSYTISYKLAPDGHKITTDESTVANIYNETGEAWYYVLDTTNQRFKLPRSSHGNIVEKYQSGTEWYRVYSDGWCEQGGEKSVSYSNATTNVTLLKTFTDTNYSIFASIGGYANNGVAQVSWQSKTSSSFVLYGDYTSSTVTAPTTWIACGYLSSYPENGQYKYLYFYVGEYSQSATEQTAGLNSSLFNGKADVDLGNLSQTGLTRINNWIANKFYSSGVQNLTKYEDIASSTTTYTAPIDGFIRVKIGATYNWQLYINGEIFQEQSRNDSDSCVTTWVVIPVLRGDVLTRSGSTYHFDGGAMWYFS